MPSWKRILKVPSSNDQTDVKISAAEFHFSAALVFYALTFKNESLFIVPPMQNLKHNGQLGFGVLYEALEAHAGVVTDKVQRAEKCFVIRGILRCHGYAADRVCDKYRLLDRHTHTKPHGNPSKVFFLIVARARGKSKENTCKRA